MRKQLMLGLKESGKSTFLAALWHLLEGTEGQSQLQLQELQPDRQYLNSIRNAWLSFTEVGRTPLRVPQQVTMALTETSTNETFEISMPDVSGESYDMQWAQRRTHAAVADVTRDCSGVLLFIHAGKVKRSNVIRFDEGGDRDAVRSGVPNTAPRDAVGKPVDWTSNMTSTQVQLVELLQFVRYLRNRSEAFPVAVVLSAWDVVSEFQEPDDWLARRLPLLSQFLVSQPEVLPHRVFGVSAQGGDLSKDRASLLEAPTPLHRVRVVERGQEEHHDLTSVLRFAMKSESN